MRDGLGVYFFSDFFYFNCKQKQEQGSIERIFEEMLMELGGQVDFDLPSWLKKWKPAQYISIKRSIHINLIWTLSLLYIISWFLFLSCCYKLMFPFILYVFWYVLDSIYEPVHHITDSFLLHTITQKDITNSLQLNLLGAFWIFLGFHWCTKFLLLWDEYI